MLVCLSLAGVAEGISVASAVPLIALVASPTASDTPLSGGGAVGAYVSTALRHLGFAPTPGVLILLIAIGILLRAVLVLLANKQVGYAVAHMATDLRLALIRAVLCSRWQYYVKQPLATYATAVAAEARRSSDAYLYAATLVALLIQTAAYVVVGCLVSWPATVVTLAVAAAIVAVLTHFVRTARAAGARQTSVTQSLLRRLMDTLQAAKPLKAMGQESLVGPLLEGETGQLDRALRREVASKEAMYAVQDPLMIAFLAVGLYAAQSQLSLPLPTVIILAVVCGRIIAALGQAQKELQRLAACDSAFWSLRATIDATEAAREPDAGVAAPALKRTIELRNVRFAYDGEPVLDGASLAISAGELTAIVGPSGAGKTTVADLIIGLLRPQAGSVLIDDCPLQTYDAQRWRALIGYVPQDTFLLHDSISVNVALGDRDLSPNDVEAALRAAGAWDFITALPDGTNTVVGERGLRMSGGQRQRIALARALVRKPQLLILDEATAALDPATEAEVCNTLQGLRGAMTILAICHKGPLIAVADRVYRVEAGCIRPVIDRPRLSR